MRLLLTHGYFLAEDAKEQQIMKPYPPLGILYLSSHLKAHGVDVEVYDSTFGSRSELLAMLDSGPPGVIGIYGNLLTRQNVIAIVERARAAGWLTILGGPEPANYAEEFLEIGADLIVQGEGERPLERLACANFARACWGSVPGLIFGSETGQIIRTGPAERIANLDAQPWPDREQIDMARYLRTWRGRHGMGSVSVITARGCPYQCAWCSHSVYGHTHRRRSPAAVVDEIEFLLDRHHPEMLWMADDVFTIHHGWLEQYASEMKRRALRIPFECITRADRLNETAAALLAGLGCTRVWIGSESGSGKILDSMRRGVTTDQVRRAVELCRANAIETGMFLMWGYEGEEIADIEATVRHVKSCRPDVFLTTVSYPIKGTPYYDRVQSKLITVQPWRESTDRDFRVAGRHSRRFYQHADGLLRAEMAMDQEKAVAARIALQAAAHEVEA